MDFEKWMQTSEAKIKASIAKTNTWTRFTGQFSNEDRTKFVAQVEVEEKHNVSVEILFKDSPSSL